MVGKSKFPNAIHTFFRAIKRGSRSNWSYSTTNLTYSSKASTTWQDENWKKKKNPPTVPPCNPSSLPPKRQARSVAKCEGKLECWVKKICSVLFLVWGKQPQTPTPTHKIITCRIHRNTHTLPYISPKEKVRMDNKKMPESFSLVCRLLVTLSTIHYSQKVLGPKEKKAYIHNHLPVFPFCLFFPCLVLCKIISWVIPRVFEILCQAKSKQARKENKKNDESPSYYYT